MQFHPLHSNERNKISVIKAEGSGKVELLNKLDESKIKLNEFAYRIFNSDRFNPSGLSSAITIIECSLSDLGLISGGDWEAIEKAIYTFKLAHCPIELAPYIRFLYADQAESRVDSINRNPPGAITIFSKPLFEDDDFPRGFYLRNFDGAMWLRGYRCSEDYHWGPDDRMIFQVGC